MRARLGEPGSVSSSYFAKANPFLEANILRTCRQVYSEGSHILYTMNAFAVIATQDAKNHCQLFSHNFPHGLDVSRIRHLRIEFQFVPNELYRISGTAKGIWSPFRNMQELKNLQFCVTIRSRRATIVQLWVAFHHGWRSIAKYSRTMRDIIAEIPVEIENVSWGLTKEQKEKGDFSSKVYVKALVLREIHKTFEGSRGKDV